MGWVKKAVYGMFFTLFLFIAMVFMEAIGINPFDSGFVTIGGLILLLTMGLFETSLVTM